MSKIVEMTKIADTFNYNTSFLCTYNSPGVFLETDNITDVEKDFIRDVIYRQEFLNIFEIEKYSDESIETILKDLYEKIKESTILKKYIKKAAKKFYSEDDEFGLVVLYSFEYMHLTHACVSEYLTTGLVSQKNSERLMAEICKK
jgi:hypothetical protein